MLLEVSGVNLDICKEFSEKVIDWLLNNDCVCIDSTQSDVANCSKLDLLSQQLNKKLTLMEFNARNTLIIRPIRVKDSDSNLCGFFPSKLDLINSKFSIVRL